MGELIDAITRGRRADVAKVLLQAKERGNLQSLLQEKNSINETPLICSIKKGYTKIAQTIIKLDADVNYTVPSTGYTSLMYAVKHGSEVITESLILAGANIHARNNQGQTAMDIAQTALEYAAPQQAEKYKAIMDILREGQISILDFDDLIARIDQLDLGTPSIQVKCETKIVMTHIDEFKRCVGDEAKIEAFIRSYIKAHYSEGVVSRDIFFGLILNAAIVFEDVALVHHILFNIPTASRSQNILTVFDVNGSSPLSNSLLHKNVEILKLVALYINQHRQDFTKVSCLEEEVENLKAIIEFSTPPSLTPNECLAQYIDPLFLRESIKPVENLVALIGAEI